VNEDEELLRVRQIARERRNRRTVIWLGIAVAASFVLLLFAAIGQPASAYVTGPALAMPFLVLLLSGTLEMRGHGGIMWLVVTLLIPIVLGAVIAAGVVVWLGLSELIEQAFGS
jgi:hypothetical protein